VATTAASAVSGQGRSPTVSEAASRFAGVEPRRPVEWCPGPLRCRPDGRCGGPDCAPSGRLSSGTPNTGDCAHAGRHRVRWAHVTKTRGTVETSSGKNAAQETQHSGGPEPATAPVKAGQGVGSGYQQAGNYVRDSYPSPPSGQARTRRATSSTNVVSQACASLDCQVVAQLL
jgi:hypothetical protein